jgi:hypothetical protein
MLPFSEPEFFAVFGRYNSAIWPLQIGVYALCTFGLATLALRARWPSRFVFVILSALWAWTGAAYHIGFFSAINGAAFVFGAGFILQALLFILHARNANLAPGAFDPSHLAGWIMIFYAAALYPLLNAWAGHAFPDTPSFGLTPCPLTIFTFGVMMLSSLRLPWLLLAIPALWSLIGGSAAFLLGVAADWAMPAACLIALAMNARKPVAWPSG